MLFFRILFICYAAAMPSTKQINFVYLEASATPFGPYQRVRTERSFFLLLLTNLNLKVRTKEKSLLCLKNEVFLGPLAKKLRF